MTSIPTVHIGIHYVRIFIPNHCLSMRNEIIQITRTFLVHLIKRTTKNVRAFGEITYQQTAS